MNIDTLYGLLYLSIGFVVAGVVLLGGLIAIGLWMGKSEDTTTNNYIKEWMALPTIICGLGAMSAVLFMTLIVIHFGGVR